MKIHLATAAVLGVGAAFIAQSATAQTSGQADIRPTPRTLTFDNVAPGTTAVKSVTVKNLGSAAGQVAEVEVKSADFRVTTDGCSGQTLAAGASCVVGVAFEPATAGTRVGHLRVADVDGCVQWVTLAGGGVTAPTARAAACESPVRTVTNTVTNTTTNSTTTTTPGTSSSTTNSTSQSQSRCASRRKFTVNVKKRGKINGVTATLAGKPAKVARTSTGWKVTVDMSSLKPGRYALRIKQTRSGGAKTTTLVKRYSSCVTPRS